MLGVLVLVSCVVGCEQAAPKERILFLETYAEEKTRAIEGKPEYKHIGISYTIEEGGKLWVTGFVPVEKEEELKALLQTDLTAEEMVWKVKALDSESFENVRDLRKEEAPANE